MGALGARVRIEAVLLTGGASRRMGEDKAALLVDGEPLGHRTARVLAEAGYPVTVLGAEPLEGHGFQRDASPHEGPLTALRRFKPTAEAVFVAACDMPVFDSRLVSAWPGALPMRMPLCPCQRAASNPYVRSTWPVLYVPLPRPS